MAACEKLRHCGPAVHLRDERVERAQAHCSREMLDRLLRLTQPNSDGAAEMPCGSQVRIEHQGPIDQGGTILDIADDDGEPQPSSAERYPLVPAHLRAAPRNPGTFVNFL